MHGGSIHVVIGSCHPLGKDLPVSVFWGEIAHTPVSNVSFMLYKKVQ